MYKGHHGGKKTDTIRDRIVRERDVTTNTYSLYTEDTIQVSMMRIEEPQTNTQVMSHLKKMKQQLQKEIQSGK